MSYKNFQNLNSEVSSYAPSADLSILNNCESLTQEAVKIASDLPGNWSRNYSSIMIMKYDDQGNPSDVTDTVAPNAPSTVNALISSAISKVKQLKANFDGLKERVSSIIKTETVLINTDEVLGVNTLGSNAVAEIVLDLGGIYLWARIYSTIPQPVSPTLADLRIDVGLYNSHPAGITGLDRYISIKTGYFTNFLGVRSVAYFPIQFGSSRFNFSVFVETSPNLSTGYHINVTTNGATWQYVQTSSAGTDELHQANAISTSPDPEVNLIMPASFETDVEIDGFDFMGVQDSKIDDILDKLENL